MGASMGLPTMPPGATIITLEKAEPCSGESCGGRNWDPNVAKPSCVTHSDAEWSTFTEEMDTLVKSFHREGVASVGLIFMFVGAIVFNPGFNFLGLEFGTSMALLYGFVAIGIMMWVSLSMRLRTANQHVDKKIEELCARMSGRGATFSYLTLFTGACKPKGAQTYRAIAISPFGASGFTSTVAVPMQPVAARPVLTQRMMVTCPPECKSGDAVSIQAPDGRVLQVMIPPDVKPGQQFEAQLPDGTPLTVAAVAVPAHVP